MSLEETLRLIVREELERVLREREQPHNVLSDEPRITITQAAAESGYSASVIRRWLDERKLTRYGSGRLTRIDPAELRRVLREMGVERSGAPTEADLDERANALLGMGR